MEACDRHVLVDGCGRGADRHERRSWIRCRPNDDEAARLRALSIRQIESGLGRRAESRVLDVADDTDDRHPRIVRPLRTSLLQPPPDGAAWVVPFCQGLVHDDRLRLAECIALIEETSGDERNTERFE